MRTTPVPGESDAWVLLEARNRDGSPAVPPTVLRSNRDLRFHMRDRKQPEEVRIEIGYEPHAVLFVNVKAYSVQKIVQSETGGWRKARAWLEFPVSRRFERDWFLYMEGLPVEIRDVRRDAALDPPVRLRITDIVFTRRWTLNAVDSDANPQPEETLLAVVSAEESLVQWMVRHWYGLIEHVWIRLVLPVMVVVIAAGMLRLVFRRREPRGESA